MSYIKLLRFKPLLSGVRSKSVPLIGGTRDCHHYSRHVNIWDQFNEWHKLKHRDIDRWTPFWRYRRFRAQPVSVETSNGQRIYKIELELGDIDANDITVTVKNNIVTVNTKRQLESDGCKQLKQNSYEYTLPSEANVEQIRSELQTNGVLIIEAPLPPEKSAKHDSKQIPVKKE